ncbi:hypothetical protein DXG01_014631 [Tephrocybe rancida]|nr:hypothetical protein DXG01_014631 [Tephrocybe rancida]
MLNFVYAHAVFLHKWPDNPGVALLDLADKFIHGYAAGDAYTDEIVMLVEGPQAPCTCRVSSYAHNWWIENADPKAELLSPKTLEKYLSHHREVRAAEDPAIAVIISDDESEAELSDSAIRVRISDDSGNDLDPATVVLSNDNVSGNEGDPAMDAIGVIILDNDYRDEEGLAMRILVSDNDDDKGDLAIDVIVSDNEADDEASGDDEDFGIDIFTSDDVLSSDEQQCFREHKTTVDARHSIYEKHMVGSGNKVGGQGEGGHAAVLLAVEASNGAGRKRHFEVYLDLELIMTTETLFSMKTAMQCLRHHQKVTGIIPVFHHVPGKWSPDSVMDIRNEVNAHVTAARACTHHTSRWAAALFMIMNDSKAKWHTCPFSYDGPDPSLLSVAGMQDLLDPEKHPEVGSGYNDSLPGPNGDGEYSTVSFMGSVHQTAMEAPAIFDNISEDIIDPPPYRPQYYPIHFRHPPLGIPTFEAPMEYDVSSGMARALTYMLSPLPDTDSSDDGNQSDVGIPGNGIIISDDNTKGNTDGDLGLIILSDSEVADEDGEDIVTISDDDDM